MGNYQSLSLTELMTAVMDYAAANITANKKNIIVEITCIFHLH